MSKSEGNEKGRFLSRRGFLAGSAAGAGAMAMPRVAAGAPQDSSDTPASTDCDEHWIEPWEWHVAKNPGRALQLNVVEHAHPQMVTGDKPNEIEEEWPSALFSYNGAAPGPTIRMGGDDVLRLHLVNHLSGNNGNYAASNPATDQARFVKDSIVARERNQPPELFKANDYVPKETPDWLLSGALVAGQHLQHTTNIHTHGLHVSPWPNADGSHSDNVLLRVIPQEDYDNRVGNDPVLPLRPNEQVVEADYEFRLGKSSGPHVETHPGGTHWYHPHPHGATADQVGGGMAGFLIVEGDVDGLVAVSLNHFRERLMLVQRIVGPRPYEAEGEILPEQAKTSTKAAFPTINGLSVVDADLRIVMLPNSVERWRVLNGSIDGQGYQRFAVIRGDVPEIKTPFKSRSDNTQYYAELAKQTEYLNDPENQLWLDQLAFDGVTLVNPAGEYSTLRVQSLPMAPANRADILFQAPSEEGEFSVWAIWDDTASDQPGRPVPFNVDTPGPVHLRLATVCVKGEPTYAGVDREDSPNPAGRRLKFSFAEAPSLLQPITVDELTISQREAHLRGKPEEAGLLRSRRVIYSGWGSATYPRYKKELGSSGAPVNQCNAGSPCNSMVIDGRKFDHDFEAHRMTVNTAEEWTVDNFSMTIHADKPEDVPAGKFHYGETLPWTELPKKTILCKAVDHPFHMHQSPFYVMSVKNSNGEELLPADENGVVWPRWQDTVRLPRNGGRAVFRSRFANYPGEFVNHCHLLNHEDSGMMQAVAVVIDPRKANYDARKREGDRSEPYPKPTLRQMYERNSTIDTPIGDSGETKPFVFPNDPYPPAPKD